MSRRNSDSSHPPLPFSFFTSVPHLSFFSLSCLPPLLHFTSPSYSFFLLHHPPSYLPSSSHSFLHLCLSCLLPLLPHLPPSSITEVVTRIDDLAWAPDPNSHGRLLSLQRSRRHHRPLPLLPPPPPSPPHPATRALQSKKMESLSLNVRAMPGWQRHSLLLHLLLLLLPEHFLLAALPTLPTLPLFLPTNQSRVLVPLLHRRRLAALVVAVVMTRQLLPL